MRIALVAPQVRPAGGQDRYVLELARQLVRHHEVHVLASRIEGLDGTPAIQHEFGIRPRPALWFAEPFARRTLRTASGAGMDVAHALGGCMPGASVVTAAYCHAAWREARARYGLGERFAVRRWYQDRVTDQSEAFERRAYAHPDLRAVIAVSSSTADDLTRHYGVPRERITVVPNGVDADTFDRARYPEARHWLRASLGLGDDVPVALFAGTYVRKGLETAIRAAAAASPDLHLVVAGSGPFHVARRWDRDVGLGERLHLLGPRADVAALYAAADLFVLPTRYDPYGMVVTEAMASGLPVVVSAAAGAAGLIEHGRNGWVVREPDDADGFAAAMRAILADRGAAAEAGVRAREAVRGLDWATIARRTEEVYRRTAA